jgi:hypothetical protein
MRRLSALFVASILATTPARAEDEKYLLGDFGLKLNLGDDWTNTAWSDWAFDGNKVDRTQLIYVWGKEIQVDVRAEDLDAWSKVFVDKIDSLKGKDPTVRVKEVREIGGHPVARFEIDYAMGDAKYAMSGATFTVEGQVVHVGLVSLGAKAAEGAKSLDTILSTAEYRKPPKAAVEGAELTAPGIVSKLPAGWHVPLEVEAGELQSPARGFGIDDLTGCWTAVRGHANAEPDVLVACPGKVNLGVVDDYSFEGVDAQIRERFFKGAPVHGVEKVLSQDGHLGFLYTFDTAAGSLVAGIVPFGTGVARLYAYAPVEKDPAFEATVRTLITDSKFEGQHPAGFGQYFTYYLKYRPFSPMVIVPALLLLGLTGLIVSLIRKGGGGPKHEY